MAGDLLAFPAADEGIAIEPDTDGIEIPIEGGDDIGIEAEPEPAPPAPAADAEVAPLALMEVLPADFKLPALIKFIPNTALRTAADEAAVYALTVPVEGPEGLQRADVALSAVRASLRAIDEHLEEPIATANALHKRLTGVRAEWRAKGQDAIDKVGRRIYDEQRRLEAIAAEERRKAQEAADRLARENARREAEEAAKQQAPAPVVEELKRQAETVTAPPISAPVAAPVLRGSTTVTTWKARIKGTPGSDEPNPSSEKLTAAQRLQVFELLKAILAGSAPLAAIELNWSYLNKRAKADKSTLSLAGIEAFEEGSVRAKSTRIR